MRLTMYDVGFGDCFSFEDETNFLLVDFGTRNSFDKVENLSSLFTLLSSAKHSSALITHFHLDHYNGFKHLGKGIFSNAYIPFISVDKTNKRPVILELAIYYYTLFRHSDCYELSKSILEQIDIAKDLTNGPITCLRARNTFLMGDNRFEVIWPQDTLEYNPKLLEYLEKFDELTKESRIFHKIKESTIQNMNDWYNSLHTKDEDTHTIREKHEELQTNQQALLQQLQNLKSQDMVLKNINFSNRSLSGCSRLYNRDVNRTSIVFHKYSAPAAATLTEASRSIEIKDVLMTGDITHDILSKLFDQGSIRKRYDVIKAPHHGSQSHFHPSLSCDEILISTGKRNGYKPISSNYADRTYQCFCTDGTNFCEIRNRGLSCGGVCSCYPSYTTNV